MRPRLCYYNSEPLASSLSLLRARPKSYRYCVNDAFGRSLLFSRSGIDRADRSSSERITVLNSKLRSLCGAYAVRRRLSQVQKRVDCMDGR